MAISVKCTLLQSGPQSLSPVLCSSPCRRASWAACHASSCIILLLSLQIPPACTSHWSQKRQGVLYPLHRQKS